MKITCNKGYVIGVVLAAAVVMLQQNIAIAAVTDRTVSVAVTAVKPLTMGPMLDDFRYAAPLNLWSVGTGTFSSSPLVPPPANAACKASYINDSNAYSGYSLKLEYDVSAIGSYVGYFSQLGGGNLAVPTKYTALSFWVKGANGGEFFKVELKNKSVSSYSDLNAPATSYYRNSASIYITDYLAGGVGTNWQKVTIPFHAFANLDGFSSMKEFVIVFEGDQSRANGIAAPRGTIYIDNIQFETSAVTSVKVSSFGHKLGVCALGGSIGNFNPDGNVYPANPSSKYTFSSTVYTSAPYGIFSEYTVNPGWAGHAFIFGGGNADDSIGAIAHPEKMGWIAVSHDFSGFNSLKFSIRSLAGQNPGTIKIELVDKDDTRFIRKTGVTTSWSGWTIDLNTDLPGLDKASIKQMNIVYEDWVIGASGGNKAGGVYIDDIRFE